MQVQRRQCTAAVVTGGDTPTPLSPINSTNNKCRALQFSWQNKEVTRIGYQTVFVVVAMPALHFPEKCVDILFGFSHAPFCVVPRYFPNRKQAAGECGEPTRS
jgi:hypothetical protein